MRSTPATSMPASERFVQLTSIFAFPGVKHFASGRELKTATLMGFLNCKTIDISHVR